MAHGDEFDVAGEHVKMSELLGELVLFTPTEYAEEVETTYGETDAVVTDLVVLSQDGQPEYTDVMVFQGAMIGALKRKLPVVKNGVEVRPGKKLLGVIGRGNAKKGQEAPYILTAPDDTQMQAARDYLAGRTVAAAVPAKSDDPFAV